MNPSKNRTSPEEAGCSLPPPPDCKHRAEDTGSDLCEQTWKNEFYAIVPLLTAAFAIRFYSLKFFNVIPTDGTSYALTARAIAGGDISGIATYGFYPVLIAITNLFVHDLETAGRIASLVFGSFLVIPLYLLGSALFSRHVAVAASLMAVVWPSLVASSCEVITQAPHATLQLAAVYLLWRAFKKPTVLNGSLAGLMIGFAYLTRPESILLFVTMPLALGILNREIRKQRLTAVSYAVSFLILFLANMLLIHHQTGAWQLSAKTDSALTDALSYYLNIPDLNYMPGYEPKSYLDILRDHPEFIWKNSVKNLLATWNIMFSPLLWLFSAIGIFSGISDREQLSRKCFLLSTFAPLAVIVVFYYISSGYIEAYLPVMFLFAASGFTRIADILSDKFLPADRTRVLQPASLLLITTAIYAIVLFAPQIREAVSDADYQPSMDNYRRDEKHIGLILKKSLPPGKIMTRWARIAFYAEREWVNIPAGTPYAEIIQHARKSGARFLIADGILYSMRPLLGEELFDPLIDQSQAWGLWFHNNPNARVKGLRPFLLYTNPRSMGVVVYEIPETG